MFLPRVQNTICKKSEVELTYDELQIGLIQAQAFTHLPWLPHVRMHDRVKQLVFSSVCQSGNKN